ncbi:MAG TPA: AI-2E family transporter [Desulfitobacteriaceae bacterium]|jgi:sporulation integral membrane protein YtvI|nr:AI-2E family transporter [Desulfitobacteriaceae bacterium]
MHKKRRRWIFFGCCLILGLIFFYSIRMVLGPFLLAFALAYLLNPVIEWLEKHKINRRWAIALTFCLIVIIIVLILSLVLPSVYNETARLMVVLPEKISQLNDFLQNIRHNFLASGLPEKVSYVIDEHLGNGEVYVAEKLKLLLDNLPAKLASLSPYLLSPILAIYFLADWKRIQLAFMRLVQQKWRLEWQRLWLDISHVLRCFIRGNLVVAVIVGILVGIGVKLIGMDYALIIGLICGISDLIPYFGPLIGAVPAVLLGFTKSSMMALEVALVILVVQQLEGTLISPKLMGDSVGLHPLWVIFALLAGEELAGFWGIFFSVPIAAVIRVIFRHIYYRLVAPKL